MIKEWFKNGVLLEKEEVPNEKDELLNIGKLLKNKRELAGLSRASLANKTRISVAVIELPDASLNKCLKYGRNVTIFPEGTTSDGSEILKFKPRLLASVISDNIPIQCVSISYPDKNMKRISQFPL